MALRDDLMAAVPQAIRDSRDAAGVAAAYNAGRTRVGSVTRADFAVWAAVTGVRGAIEDAAHDPTSPIRAVALSLLDFLQGGVSDTLDFSKAENQAMLGYWRSAGKVTSGQEQYLMALATHPDPIDELIIRAACWSDDGIWQL
ncbi:MAG: hypothetical protein PHU46_12200 [Rhodocyclaceae bacterium]|nr:hypothetical protein [Rhodocyclaceae bacterium]